MFKVVPANEAASLHRWQMPAALVSNRLGEGPGLSFVDAAAGHEKQGFDEGFARGYQQGLEQANEELAAQGTSLRQILHSLSAPLEQMDQEIEQQLLEVAMAVARQVIRREIKCDPNQIIAVVKEATAALPDSQRERTLVLHPEDATLVRQLLLAHADEPAWRIEEDPALTRGGCKVMTSVSYVDATIESRVAKLAAQVLGGERHSDHGVVAQALGEIVDYAIVKGAT